MKIANEILDVLAECKVEGNAVFLPSVQFERKTYEAINKCLTNIGGKWNRKEQAHIFTYNPAEALDNLVFTGETEDMKKTFQFFPTPKSIGRQMCEMAELSKDSTVIDPSCGKGDLLDAIYEQGVTNIMGIELNEQMGIPLSEKPYKSMVGIDFLKFAADQSIKKEWTHIIMNPPFSKQQEIDHIMAAYEMLPENGTLVSVVSTSPFFRTNAKASAFREFLDNNNAIIVDVPEGAFKESGTMVATKIIKIKKCA